MSDDELLLGAWKFKLTIKSSHAIIKSLDFGYVFADENSSGGGFTAIDATRTAYGSNFESLEESVAWLIGRRSASSEMASVFLKNNGCNEVLDRFSRGEISLVRVGSYSAIFKDDGRFIRVRSGDVSFHGSVRECLGR